MRPSLAMLAFTVGVTLAGCAGPPQPGPNPYPAPPPARAEIVPLAPVSDGSQVWQPGHWDWTGAAYVWTSGIWVPSAGHGHTWQLGFWDRRGATWIWVPAHWI